MSNLELTSFLKNSKEEYKSIKEKALNSNEIRQDGPHSSNLYIKLPQALERLYENLEHRASQDLDIKDYILNEIIEKEQLIKEDREILKRDGLGLITRVGLTVRVNISIEEIKEYRKVLELI